MKPSRLSLVLSTVLAVIPVCFAQTNGSVFNWGYGDPLVPPVLSDIVAIANADNHALGLRSNGIVVGWGYDDFGQATPPPGLNGVKRISANRNFSMALKSDGTIVTWGANSYGRGDVPLGLANIVAIAAGDTHALALRNNGTVVGWGYDPYAANIPSGLSNVVDVAAGAGFSMALKTDGTVAAWGSNANGETNVPAGLNGVKAISAGYMHCVALRSNGTVVCWGLNSYGQCNVPANLTNVTAVAGGFGATLALKNDGSVSHWGWSLLQPPANMPPAIALAGAYNRGGIITRAAVFNPELEDKFVALGSNATFSATVSSPTPVNYQWKTGGTNIVGATNSTLVITNVQADRTINIVASNAAGSTMSRTANLFAVTPPSIISITPGATVPAGTNVILNVNATGDHATYRWNVNGNLIWGEPGVILQNIQEEYSGPYFVIVSNAVGVATSAVQQLTVLATAPYLLEAPTNQMVTIGGAAHFYASASGSAPLSYQWQHNGVDIDGATDTHWDKVSNVQFNDAGTYSVIVSNAYGTTKVDAELSVFPPQNVFVFSGDYRAPVPAELFDAATVASGSAHQLAIRADGKLVSWSDESYGQPSGPSGATNIVGIAGGFFHTLALNANGTVQAWGPNEHGQCNVPPDLQGVKQVAAHDHLSVALRTNGTLAAWGSLDDVPIPQELKDIVSVSLATDYRLFLRANGTVVATHADYFDLEVPSDLTNVIAIAAGEQRGLALKADGTLVQWGVEGRQPPAGLSNIVAIASGYYGEDMALREDGTIVVWNWAGELPVPWWVNNVISMATGESYRIVAMGDGRPAITIHPFSQAVVSGKSVQLHTKAVGAGQLYYQWQRNGVELAGETSASITISNFSAQNAGEYRTVVTNDLGIASSAIAILAEIPAPSLSVEAKQDSVKIGWPAEGYGFQLETTTNAGSEWTAVTNSVVIKDGVNSIQLPANSSAQFFRLRIP